jgi:hypothetical protein
MRCSLRSFMRSAPKWIAFTLIFAALGACERDPKTANDPTALAANKDPRLGTALLATTHQNVAAADAYRQALKDNTLPILPLAISGEAAEAQALALSHAPIIEQLRGRDGQKMRAEVMAVYKLRESDFVEEAQVCKTARCYRLEVYDFARNTLLLGLANLDAKAMISWRAENGRKPEIPDRLKRLAIDIAIDAPELTEALGGIAPKFTDAQMASTKTALNGTRCERSRHLCVAPTFVQGNVAVWAIVDLTDMKLVGVQWTDVGTRVEGLAAQKPPTEQTLADAAIMQKYCERNNALKRDGWELNYMLTASDGLRIGDVRFSGKDFLTSAKLVDWHVSYSEREGFGYADAVGCPSFSSAAVLPFSPPSVTDIQENGVTVGFKLEQEFRSLGWPGACNYSYRQAFEFYSDGRFRPSAGSIGAGCGNDGTYRPLLRIEPTGRDWKLSVWNGSTFENIINERYFTNDNQLAANGTRFKLSNAQFSFGIQPARGQFAHSRTDNELVYVTAAGKDEGASDLPTLGSCCNTNYEQGPEQFIGANPELLNQGLVLWYVPQLKNDTAEGKEFCWARQQLSAEGTAFTESFPCIGGPMFMPFAVEAAKGG